MTTSVIGTAPAIEAIGLGKTFGGRGRVKREALAEITFSVERGRTLAIVGESGAGKSTLVRCIAGLETPTAGETLIHGAPHACRAGRVSPVQMVFQNPSDALDSMRSVGSSIAEPLRGRSRAARRARVAELLSLVGINPARAKDRPRSFSGGQLQRIVIARALAPEPSVLLCDEPTSALDVSVQAQIINLLLKLQKEHGFAAIVVTHDLAVAKVLADDVLVLRHGKSLFYGAVNDLLDENLAHDPYVTGLVRASRHAELGLGAGEQELALG
ncbi:ATP-binding cassette domain-containing protein [Amycolatopsis sp. NPDC006131]|uniref:ABC transporter ATP-binding protein n=1 Tax=Amycolatopsis sp. NPDC006131 TaxID=3156731 RepID=UPI0033A47086